MPKNIAYFADGTWDEPCNHSNVVRLYTAADNTPGVQVTFYDSGVGTEGNSLAQLFDGATGAGLFQKIKHGYAQVASQFLPGDLIYIFGFSRGAYIARSLAGMIAVCGLPTVNQNDSRCVDMAFEAYRNVAQRPSPPRHPQQDLADELTRHSDARRLGYGRVPSAFPPFSAKSTSATTAFSTPASTPTSLTRCMRSPSTSSGSSFNPLSGPPRPRPARPSCRSGFPASTAMWAEATIRPRRIRALQRHPPLDGNLRAELRTQIQARRISARAQTRRRHRHAARLPHRPLSAHASPAHHRPRLRALR